MSPTAKAANNGHHCPKAHGREGNCRPWQGGGSKPQHCVAHQKVCPLHHEKHLQTEPCPTCEKVLKFTGSRPPPVEHQPRDYRPSNPPSNQRRPSQPRNRGARRSAGSRHGRGGNKGGNGQSKDDPNTIRATTTPDLQTWSDLFSSPLFLALALALSFVLVVTVIGLMSWTRRW
ncbi:hypothetical protein D6D21_05777 [Aureobasidium pullulans]|uniref:Uncharacterized protein n=1 Tax=Aureobasidium pullulans TaxID=5580 RepID=A0AB74IW57_AURPU|nr:hypothetical protein D6D21_05777 [Aureobasidium pullulans]